MAILTREQILAASDVAQEVVSVPEWGGEVLVRGLTLKASKELHAKHAGMDDETLGMLTMTLCVLNEAGEQMFTLDDLPLLEQKSTAAMTRVLKAVARVNGMDEDAPKDTDTE